MGMEMLLLLAVFIGLMYFMTIRPQKKRMEQQRQMLDALQPGSRVLLNSGIFGTIRAMGDQQMVIELAPGVEITALKQTVIRAARADEEEFEFTDDQLETTPADVFAADAVVEGELSESDQQAFEASEILTSEELATEAAEAADEASEAVYQPGQNVIYQPGSNEVSATDDAGERPQER